MKRIIALFTAVLLSFCGLFSLTAFAENDDNVVTEAKQAVVCIASGIYFDEHGQIATFDSEGSYSTGTGFGVGYDGEWAKTFITNCHVVADGQNVYEYVYVLIDGADLYNESTLVKCKVVYADPTVDFAIIQAENEVTGVATLPVASAETAESGEEVYALGFPSIAEYEVDIVDYTVEDITVTDGIVSRHLTSDGVKCMAHTANINHGNSGGPLINEQGQVIGINTFGYTEDVDTRYYAIYIDYVSEKLKELNIPFTDANEADSGNEGILDNQALIIALCACAGVIAIVVVVAVVVSKKKKQPTPEVEVEAPPVIEEPVAEKVTEYYLCGIAGCVKDMSVKIKDKVTVGRSPDMDVVIPADTKGISREHCKVELQGEEVLLTDLNSSQGTFLNGKRIPKATPVKLKENSEIFLGSDRHGFALKKKN